MAKLPDAAISIDQARQADEPQMLDLLERCRLPTAGLHDHFRTALIARRGHQVIGCVALELYGEAALLRSLAVNDDDRQGSRFVRSALRGVSRGMPDGDSGDAVEDRVDVISELDAQGSNHVVVSSSVWSFGLCWDRVARRRRLPYRQGHARSR